MIDYAYAKELFEYVPETGDLIWKTRPLHHFIDEYHMNEFNCRIAGRKASRDAIKIGKERYRASHIVWLLHKKVLPSRLNRIDASKRDNRIENLYDAMSDNKRNASLRTKRPNKIRGLYWRPAAARWEVRIGPRYIGCFKYFEDAIAARNKAEMERFLG